MGKDGIKDTTQVLGKHTKNTKKNAGRLNVLNLSNTVNENFDSLEMKISLT